MSWEIVSPFDAAHLAALAARKPLVYVAPPAGWACAPLFAALDADASWPGLLVLAPELSDASDLATIIERCEALRPVHILTSQARTGQLLQAGAVRTLVTTPPDALGLLRRAALKADALPRVAVAWPGAMAASGQSDALDTLLAEARGAQRLILTADETRITDFLTRHAHRAPIAVLSRPPEHTAGPVRYLTVADVTRTHRVRDLLDELLPRRTVLWDPDQDRRAAWAPLLLDPSIRFVDAAAETPPAELAVATDLVTGEVLAQLRQRARGVLVVVRASQIPYLARLAAPLRATRVGTEADRARTRAADLRRAVRGRLAGEQLDAELLALEPLYEEYDPALVAAAAASLVTTAPTDQPAADVPAWVRVHVNVGRAERLRPADLVGALVNGVGIAKDRVGKIDIRERFTLAEIRAEDAETVVRELTGLAIRGRRVSARLDRR